MLANRAISLLNMNTRVIVGVLKGKTYLIKELRGKMRSMNFLREINGTLALIGVFLYFFCNNHTSTLLFASTWALIISHRTYILFQRCLGAFFHVTVLCSTCKHSWLHTMKTRRVFWRFYWHFDLRSSLGMY